MATQEMILKLSFDDEGTFTGLEDINQELNKVDDSTKAVEKSTKTLKAQYAELKKQQDQFDPGTKKFNELSQKMGELKDRMNDAADAVKGNTGPAVEGLTNSFGMMGTQIRNLDFEGLSQSVNLVAGNLGRLKPEDISKGFSDLLTAGKNALKGLGQAIKANPIFFLAAAVVGVIVYWKELEALVGNKSGMIQSLKQQVDLLSRQTKVLERNVTLLKSTKASAGEIYQAELSVLDAKDKQLTAAYKLALLEGEQAAISESRAALEDARAEKQAKLNATIAEGHSIAQDIVAEGNKDVALQQAKIKASQEFVDKAQQLEGAVAAQKKQQENLNIELAKAAEYAYSERGNTDAKAKSAKRDLETAQAKVDAQEKLIKQSERDLKIIKEKGVEVWNNTKTAEEQAKIDEAAAVRKAQREAEAKKLADELLSIKKELADWDRRNLSDLDKELFLLNERQKLEVASYQKAKQSAEAMAALLQFHKEEEQAVKDKYAKIEYDKQVAADIALQEESKQKYNTISNAALEQGKANELRLLSEKDKELQINKDKYDALIAEADLRGVDTKVFLDAQLAEEDAIKKKWADKEKADAIALQEMKVAAISQGFAALAALNDSFTARTEKTAKRQFNVNKALNIAMSLIDTYSAIVKALNSPETVPTSVKIAQAVAVGVMGFANVAKIAKTQFGGMTPDTSMQTGNPDSTTQANAPAVDFSGGNFNNNAPGTVETYVLAGNVANALEARQKIIDQSHL
jgi:hypothetical protein